MPIVVEHRREPTEFFRPVIAVINIVGAPVQGDHCVRPQGLHPQDRNVPPIAGHVLVKGGGKRAVEHSLVGSTVFLRIVEPGVEPQPDGAGGQDPLSRQMIMCTHLPVRNSYCWSTCSALGEREIDVTYVPLHRIHGCQGDQ